ncbi:MAG: hypothetical protein V7K40_06455 [Nostoc sp.]|uniref:hypothetical protein n=1 Tax=Nostoc sp. TaxID=1180 RepID=UPI002FF66BDB
MALWPCGRYAPASLKRSRDSYFDSATPGNQNPSPADITNVIASLGEREWTQDYTAGYAAEALNLTINIYNPDGSHYYTASPTNPTSATQTIHMTYTGNHFNSHTRNRLSQ